MKTILLAIICLTISISSFSQSAVEKEVTSLSKKRVRWLLEGKVDSLATLYDENCLTVHGNGMVRTTAEHLKDIKEGRPTYKSIEVKETSVRDFGTTAVLVGKGVFNISINGTDMNANMAYTEVYQRKGKTWKLIARHASQIE